MMLLPLMNAPEEILILNDLSSRKGFFITILKSPLLTSYNVQNNWH